MCLPVVSKKMWSYDVLNFRIKAWEKVRVTKQLPVKESYVKKLHTIEHYDKSDKETKETKIIFYAIPATKNKGSCKCKKCHYYNYPANYVSSFKSFFSIRNSIYNLLRSRREELLVLNKSDSCI